jgi:predicted RNase H-like nuclease
LYDNPKNPTTLLVGFDSAWTEKNSGGLVGVIRNADGSYRSLGNPEIQSFPQASATIHHWQTESNPALTLILLDQPTIVKNPNGQRPVENIVGSAVSLRYGGAQPANTGRAEMFGKDAPIWPFLQKFGGAANPLESAARVRVFETYPVLTAIASSWILPDNKKNRPRPTGRLPKYNPGNREKFLIDDWIYTCDRVKLALSGRGLADLENWINGVALCRAPRKRDQDCLDACICLVMALHLIEDKDCLMVGNTDTGYMVVPHGVSLEAELQERCRKTSRASSEWVQRFRLPKTIV